MCCTILYTASYRISLFGEVVLPDGDPASPGGNSLRRRKEDR